MSKRINLGMLLSACLLGSLMTACGASSDMGADVDEESTEGTAVQALSQDQSATSLPPSKQLAREWMRWGMEQPYTTGPISDPTGDECAMGQEGPVWFLAGTYGGAVTRHCTIPAGKQLYFPLVNTWTVFPPAWFPNMQSIHDIMPDITTWLDNSRAKTCALTLRVDGQEVIAGGFDEMVDDLYVRAPDPFKVDVNPEDSFLTKWGIPGGEMYSVGAGHYAHLKALSPGDHVLELGGDVCNGNAVSFETSATYYLHVEE